MSGRYDNLKNNIRDSSPRSMRVERIHKTDRCSEVEARSNRKARQGNNE